MHRSIRLPNHVQVQAIPLLGSPAPSLPLLGYGWFDPTARKVPANTLFPPKKTAAELVPLPLLIWLHGAGEGGLDPEIAYTGNYVTGIAGSSIQRSLGGAACILVPQCPTVWMDNGSEKLGRSNRSIYAAPLMELIRSFIEAHKDIIDTDRIWIGDLSNGGFLTLRMTADYPGFFAGAVPVCAPFYPENASQAEIDAIAATPTWFVHCKGDELVPPEETSFPLYAALRKAGAADLHFTLFDHVYDVTGKYRNADGSVRCFFSHGLWIPVSPAARTLTARKLWRTVCPSPSGSGWVTGHADQIGRILWNA